MELIEYIIPNVTEQENIFVQEEIKKELERQLNNINLKTVHQVYKKYFYLESTNRIDIILATVLSQKLKGIPIWLILIGNSGDMKSVQLNSLFDLPQVQIIHNITSKTLVNGFKNKKLNPDLAPLLNNKIMIIPDMAQILKLPPIEKAEIWGQFRDLFDGHAGKFSGMGSFVNYKGLKVSMIAGSTPAIDEQILIHQDLGTRELLYRLKPIKDKSKTMNYCLDFEGMEEKINEELKSVNKLFIDSINEFNTKLTKEQEEKLKIYAQYTALLRTPVPYDYYWREISTFMYPEEPTRILKQLKKLFVCLKSLSKDYTDLKAFEILEEICVSSCFPLRTKLYNHFASNPLINIDIKELMLIFKTGYSSIKRELLALEHLNLLNRIPDTPEFIFSLNSNYIISLH